MPGASVFGEQSSTFRDLLLSKTISPPVGTPFIPATREAQGKKEESSRQYRKTSENVFLGSAGEVTQKRHSWLA